MPESLVGTHPFESLNLKIEHYLQRLPVENLGRKVGSGDFSCSSVTDERCHNTADAAL